MKLDILVEGESPQRYDDTLRRLSGETDKAESCDMCRSAVKALNDCISVQEQEALCLAVSSG